MCGVCVLCEDQFQFETIFKGLCDCWNLFFRVRFEVRWYTNNKCQNFLTVVLVSVRLSQQYIYPQAFLQPNLLLQSHLSPSTAALASPYLDYSSAYSHFTPTGLEQYPYTPSPSPSAGYLGYSFSPGTPAPTLTTSPTPPAAIHPSLAALTAMSAAPQAFLHYPVHQPDRMQ